MPRVQGHIGVERPTSNRRIRASQDQNFSDVLARQHDKPRRKGEDAQSGTTAKGASHDFPDGIGRPSMDDSPKRSTVCDPSSEQAAISNVENAKVPAQLPKIANTANALLGLPVASASQSVAWSRVFGQHLIANDYLSIVSIVEAADGCPDGNGVLSASVDVHPVRLSPSRASPPIPPATQSAQTTDAQAGEIPTQLPAMDDYLGGDGIRGAHDAPLAALENALALDQLWHKRALRLTHDSTGTCTAWVRDFGLHESEVQKLAASLVHHATLHGVYMKRIVINGREIWRVQD